MQQRFSSKRAFTIVELVVAIAASTVVLALLLPALSTVAASARSNRCQTNLRQMAIAAQNYAAIWDAFPAALRYESGNSGFLNVSWDWVTTFSNHALSPGPLWSFTDHPGEIQQCPDFHGRSSYGESHTGYNYNTTYIGGESPFPSTGWKNFRRGVAPHACSRSSSCAMFGDGGWKNGSNKYMRAPLNTEQDLEKIYAGGQAFRHSRATNIAFVDCHVASANKSHPGALAKPELLAHYMGFPSNGFLCDDDRMYDPR